MIIATGYTLEFSALNEKLSRIVNGVTLIDKFCCVFHVNETPEDTPEFIKQQHRDSPDSVTATLEGVYIRRLGKVTVVVGVVDINGTKLYANMADTGPHAPVFIKKLAHSGQLGELITIDPLSVSGKLTQISGNLRDNTPKHLSRLRPDGPSYLERRVERDGLYKCRPWRGEEEIDCDYVCVAALALFCAIVISIPVSISILLHSYMS